MTRILVLLCAWLVLAGAAPSRSTSRTYYVDDARGRDSGTGGARSPWKSIGRANRVAPGSVVRVAPGEYDEAPTAPGVRFIGADAASKGARVIDDKVELTGRGTEIVGFTLEEGLDFAGGARNNLVLRCVVEDHFGIWGGADAAPRNNRVAHTRMRIEEMAAHRYGDDRDPTPRIVAPIIEDCDITVTRSDGVLWRWSGVDDARIVRTTIRLVNGGHHNDDDASWKWLYVRRALIADSRIVLDHDADFGGTGPFAPMWRDSTWGIRMVRTTIEAVRGDMIFSPNTAGSWVCSCGGHRFENVVLKAPGTVRLYQCPRPSSDVWVGSRVQAGRFDRYNTGSMPKGLSIRNYVRVSR